MTDTSWVPDGEDTAFEYLDARVTPAGIHRFTASISLTAWGLPYCSLPLETGDVELTGQADEDRRRIAEAVAKATVAWDLARDAIVAELHHLRPALPTPDWVGARVSYGPPPAQGAPQYTTEGTDAAALQALGAGVAQAGAPGGVEMVTNRYGKNVYVVRSMPGQMFQDLAKAEFVKATGCVPEFVGAYDNREQLASPSGNGHSGRIVVLNKRAPGQAAGYFGNNAAAWVDFEADGSLKLTLTKAWKDAPFQVQAAMVGQQAAPQAPAYQQAPQGYGQPSAMPGYQQPPAMPGGYQGWPSQGQQYGGYQQ